MTKETKVHVVDNILEARKKIEEINHQGYGKEKVYVLTHDKKRTEEIAEHIDSNEIGLVEEGVLVAVANLFRSTGNELRAKMRSMGVTSEHAEHLEEEMDKGKIVILAWKGTTYDESSFDENITFDSTDSYTPMT